MYDQIITPNYNWPYYGGLCEGFVEGTVGQASKPAQLPGGKWTTNGVYPSATYAFKNGLGSHAGTAPKGTHVALYFSLGDNANGHTAILRPDGTVASSTQAGYHNTPYIHPSLQDLINVYTKAHGSCIYLGWSEYLGKLQIVKEVPMGITIKGEVATVSAYSGRTDIFALGSDGQLWQKYFVTTGKGFTSAWTAFHGGGAVSGLTASSNTHGRIDIYATNKDGALIHWWYVDGWKPDWNGPENLGTIK